jgi:hypothetical protein
MPIINPTPITLSVADKYWIIKCTIMQDIIIAVLAPWDGQYIVGNRSTQKRLQIPDMAVVCSPVFAKVAAMASQPANMIKVVDVDASDSLAAVTAVAVYDSGETQTINGQTVPLTATYSIPDLFAAVAADVELAQAYGAVMAAIEGAI